MKLIIDDVWQITMTSIILFNLGIFKSEYLTSFTLSRNICACSGYNNIVLFLYHLNVSLNDDLLIMFSYLDYVYIAYQKSVLSFLPRFTVYGKGILLKTSSKTFFLWKTMNRQMNSIQFKTVCLTLVFFTCIFSQTLYETDYQLYSESNDVPVQTSLDETEALLKKETSDLQKCIDKKGVDNYSPILNNQDQTLNGKVNVYSL